MTPPPSPASPDQFAPLYSRAERVRYFVITVLLGAALVGVVERWGRPALRSFAEHAHCTEWLGVNGLTWMWYAVCVGPMLVTFLIGWPTLGRRALRWIRLRQYPEPGQKVWRPTRIVHGRRAVLRGVMAIALLVAMLGMAGWGAWLASDLAAMTMQKLERPEVQAACVVWRAAQS